MTLHLIAQYLLAHWVEWVGFATTVLGIWLTTRRTLWCWPVVLAADLLYLDVFFRARLYSDTLLQVFFIVFTLYGWWHWWRGVREEGTMRVTPLGVSPMLGALVIGVAGSLALAKLALLVHAALPYLDATLASFSLVASWWQARKHTANWWLWIVVNVAYIGEYVYKDLWPTAALYALLVGLAVLGLRNWQRAEAAA
ncbi:MAG TPA: nicotinamide riboside transporter PnuC [Terracidiphilus sp.]|nr:nicotinamide riboside transporter PnuC [Terracidiphilus sp.]